MEDDVEIYASLIKNNPFWSVYDSRFEVLQAQAAPELPEINPPDSALPVGAYISITAIALLALGWFLLNRKIRGYRAEKFPKIYFDQKHSWYCFQFEGEEPSLMTGTESWMPENYYFDISREGFFSTQNSEGSEQPATIEQVRKAALPRIPAALFPLAAMVIGFAATYIFFQLDYEKRYENYLEQVAQREYQLSLFDPFEGMCQLNSKNSLIPQQMTVQLVFDLPEGSNPPIGIQEISYLEGDALDTPDGEISLPTQLFLHNAPDQIVGDADDYINFRERASGSSMCDQGNTYFTETDETTGESVAYLVPISELKNLTLGPASGSYETKLFGLYDANYLINTSSYEVRSVQYRYSIDNIPGCNTVIEGNTFTPGFMGNGEAFVGQLVPWGTSPTETINVPDFQMCSSIFHLEYR